jgi:CRP-like cAMP-binding protein
MEKAFRLLEGIAPLEEGIRTYLESAFVTTDIRKGTLLVRHGHICKTIGFIEKGLIRGYRINENVSENTCYFMTEGEVCTSIRSFFKQVPATEVLETLEPCRIISLRYDQYKHAYKTYSSFQEHRAELLEKYYLLAEEREEMRQKKGFDQFCHFLDHFPGLLDRVLEKHIASFLGLTPTYFSSVKDDYLIRARRR